MMASRYSALQSAWLAGLTWLSTAWTAASPRTSHPASSSMAISGLSIFAAAAHLGIEHNRFGHRQPGLAVDIDVADAFEMGKDRHARLHLHAGDQILAAARHDDVERAVEDRKSTRLNS